MNEVHVAMAGIDREAGGKESFDFKHYVPAIVVLSINTLLLYFYYNSFAPVLSQMAKDYRFSDAERDSLIGTTLFLKL